MPTVFSARAVPVFLLLGDRAERPHVHVEREVRVAKFWLQPVEMCDAGGFEGFELRRLTVLIEEQSPRRLGAWHEFFTD
jgi:hypothetical protein